MRPFAAAGRPWHPSELARLGRNAVEDPPQAGCLGRTAAAPWRISRRGWASACDVAGGCGGCRCRTTQRIEATGLAQELRRRARSALYDGDELTPSPLAPREGSQPEGPRRRRRLGHAAVFGRVIEPDPTEGRGTPKRSLATTQWSPWRTPTMTPKRGKGAFRFWRQRGRMFILIRDIAGVRGGG